MFDQNVLNSVMGTGAATRTESRSKAAGGDAEAFDAALNDATKTKGKSKTDESKSEAKAEGKESARKREAKEHEDQKAAVAGRPQDRTSAIHMQKLMKKNVDTLSLAEKQALRVAEFANENQQAASALPKQTAHAPQLAKAAPAGKTAKNPVELGVGKEASGKVREQAERADERTQKAVEELQKQDQPRSGSASLEQVLAKEASFAEEIGKTQATERNQERQSVIDQVLQQIEVRNFKSRTELNLKLNPEYLGELKVKLVHTDDGVRADFETSSKKTRELLREGVEELKTQAQAKGIRLRAARFTLVDKVDTEAVG